jgi:drug/metabolite transporter (DMT)-like permease
MSLRSPLTRRAALGGLAVSGLIAGHCFAYRFFGEASAHAHHHSGHSHLPYVLAVIAGLLVAAIGSVVDHRIGSRVPRISTTASLLLGAQIAGFVGLSVLDRVMGMPGTEIGSRAFWVGLLIQVVVAGLGAILLAVLRRTIEAIDSALRAELPATTSTELDASHLPLTFTVPSLAMATGGPTFRGPPLDR